MDKVHLFIIHGTTKTQREQFLKFKEPYVKESWLRYIKKMEDKVNGRNLKDADY